MTYSYGGTYHILNLVHKVRGEPYSVLGQGVLEHLHFLIADGNEDAIVTCLALYKAS